MRPRLLRGKGRRFGVLEVLNSAGSGTIKKSVITPIYYFNWSFESVAGTLTPRQFECKLLSNQQMKEITTMREARVNKCHRATTRLLSATIISLAVVMAGVLPSVAQEQPSHEMEMKVPQTAMDHSAMAEHYQKKAAEYRADIEAHKKMLADYKKAAVETPKLGENPHVKAERLHCEKYIKAAEALEAEATESAKFHTLRAKEMEGK